MTMPTNQLSPLKKLLLLNRKRVFFLSSLILLIWVGYSAIPLKDPLFDIDYSHVVLDKNDQILRVYLNRKEQWLVPQEIQPKIPHRLITSILMFEDRYFYNHPGVNPVSIWNAWKKNKKAGRVISGGSTLTMQLARLSEPKSRTYSHKLLEMLQALKIEWKYSKKEILSTYITRAPFGGNIQGFYAASLLYFSKKPLDLTWGEAATVMPPVKSSKNKRVLMGV